MEKIALVTGSRDTADSLYKQLKFFISDKVIINPYVIDEGITGFNNEELMVFSSQALRDEAYQVLSIPQCRQIIGQRTINYDGLDEIVSLPQGENVLLVNDVEESAREVENALKDIGLDHLNITLYYPGAKCDPSQFNVAITAGEIRMVPAHIKHVVDMGSRIFDFRTIAKILASLNLLEESSGSFSKMYLEKILKVAKNLASSRAEIISLNENLHRVIESFNAGVLMYDKSFRIIVFNDSLKHILKVNRYLPVGSDLRKVIQNKKLLNFLTEDQDNHLFELSLDGLDFVVSKFTLSQDGITCASFKSMKRMTPLEESIIKKGHVAKYHIGDIVGTSDSITRLKEIIPKLSYTDMTMLIQGESGTGKELVASAIHNASQRASAPFLAVNFSALPDDLIESELFGYAEGAFTGAKKGGKLGLFEEADGGTIFLDEIGDISLKVQSRLLRVLEEREIMPVGSNEIKSIDVRVIAATNKDLKKMVEEKTFREDLYYRLKMGFVHLQPLRERREDIPELADHLVSTLSTGEVRLDEKLIKLLMSYDWPGNIRELKNTINYMLAVRSGNMLEVEDLPHEVYFGRQSDLVRSYEGNKVVLEGTRDPDGASMNVNAAIIYFLRLIERMKRENQIVSRVTLSEKSKEGVHYRTENQVRRLLTQLDEYGFISLSKGRNGIALTLKGEELIRGKQG